MFVTDTIFLVYHFTKYFYGFLVPEPTEELEGNQQNLLLRKAHTDHNRPLHLQ